MRKRVLALGLGGALLAIVGAVPFLLAEGEGPASAPTRAPPAISAGEHARTLDALKPPKRARPAIAIVTLNDSTEVADFLVAYGMLRQADVADVTVVAPEAHPVVVADDGGALGVARPVVAGLGGRRAVRVGAGQDVVPVGGVAAAVDRLALGNGMQMHS